MINSILPNEYKKLLFVSTFHFYEDELNNNEDDIMKEIPIQIVSTGLRDISLRNLQRF